MEKLFFAAQTSQLLAHQAGKLLADNLRGEFWPMTKGAKATSDYIAIFAPASPLYMRRRQEDVPPLCRKPNYALVLDPSIPEELALIEGEREWARACRLHVAVWPAPTPVLFRRAVLSIPRFARKIHAVRRKAAA